jgi:hypothetical protein
MTACEHSDVGGEFPFTWDDAHRFYLGRRDWAGDHRPTGEADFESPGCLEIGHQGCTNFTMLVTTGELAGTVWDVWDNTWMPARAPSTVLDLPHEPIDLGPTPTFGAWYDAWLTQALAQLATIA